MAGRMETKPKAPLADDSSEDDQPPVDEQQQVQAQAAWGTAGGDEPLWYPAVAIMVAMALWLILPTEFALPRPYFWIVPGLELAVLLPLLYARQSERYEGSPLTRVLSMTLIALINAANLISLAELIYKLLHHEITNGQTLLYSALAIWITNVIVFALWYWELDRGGPHARQRQRHRQPDFLFPQMSTPYSAPKRWCPDFVDYLYTSFTNATAFSPTDTMPLTNWAKLLMMGQAFASLVTVGLVAARAVNILR